MSPRLRDEMRNALRAVFHDMQHHIALLEQALEAEHTALDENNSPALDQAGSRKQSVMLQLEKLDAERQQIAAELSDQVESTDPEWIKLLGSLRACQLLNLRNGHAVSQRLLQVRRALSILTGCTGNSPLYGQTGALHINLQSRVFAEV